MRAPLARIEIWTDLRCVAGSKRKAIVQHPISPNSVKRLRGDGYAEWKMPQSDASAAELLEDRAALLVLTDGTVEEYRITAITSIAATGGDQYVVRAIPILFDLDGASLITEYDAQGIPSFAGMRYQITATELIDLVILPQLVADGLTWVSRGTVDPTITFDLEWEEVTPLGLLHLIEEKTGAELDVTPNGTTGYEIHLRTSIAGSQPVADLRAGKNLRDSEVGRDSSTRLSDCLGIGAADPAGRPAVIGRATWRISAVNTGTNRITFEDPEGGADPILEDDQLDGLYVYVFQGLYTAGTTHLISDTVGQAVQVPDASLFAVGDLIEIRADVGTVPEEDDAPLLTTLHKPSAAVTRFGSAKRPDLAGERNLLGNGYLTEFNSGTDAPPDGITLSAAAVPRDLQNTDPIDATLGGSALSLRFKPRLQVTADVTAGTATVHVLQTENVRSGITLRIYDALDGEDLVVLSFTSTSITFTTNFANNYLLSAGAAVIEPGAEFPGVNVQGRGLCAGVTATWDAIRAPIRGGTLFFLQARVTLRNAHQYSIIQLEARTQTRHAVQQSTVTEQEVTLGVNIEASAGETIQVTLMHAIDIAGAAYSYPSMPGDNELVVNGIALTQTDYWPTKIPHFSNANALWHAVQRALAAGSLAVASWRVGLVDLTALDPIGWPDDELILGGTVRVSHSAIGATNELLRIVEFRRRDLFAPADAEVTLNALRTPISEMLDDLLGGNAGNGTGGSAPGGGSGTPGVPGVTPPGGTPLPPGQSPSAGLIEIPSLLPFYAGAQPGTRVTLTNQPSGLTEIDSGQRLFVDLSRCTKLMLMRRLDTPGFAGSYAAIQYSLDKGATWAGYLDGALGPWVLLDNTLEADDYGDTVSPVNAARQLVLLRVVTLNGNGSDDPVLGNYFLHAWFAASVAAFPIGGQAPLPPGAGCHLVGSWPQRFDPSRWATIQDLYNHINQVSNPNVPMIHDVWFHGVTPDANEDFDSSILWAGHKTLRGTHAPTGTRGGGFNAVVSDGGVPGFSEAFGATQSQDYWFRQRIRIPVGFLVDDAGVEHHFTLFELAADDNYSINFNTTLDEVSIWVNRTTGTKTVIGAASAMVVGVGFIEVGGRYRGDATSGRVDWYIGTPCTALTSVGTTSGAGDHFGLAVNDHSYVPSVSQDFHVGDFQIEPTTPTNASPFGWIPVDGCPIPGGIQYESDLSAYAGLAAFVAARDLNADGTNLVSFWFGPPADDADNFIDPARLFNGKPAFFGLLRQTMGSPLYDGPGYQTTFANGAGSPTLYDDITQFVAFELEAGFDVPGSTGTGGGSTYDDGHTLLMAQTDVIAVGKTNYGSVVVQNGRLIFSYTNQAPAATHTNVDLGPVSSWTGRPLQLLLRFKRIDASTIQATVALNSPCQTTPTIVHQASYAAAAATNKWKTGVVFQRAWTNDTDGPATPKGYRFWQHGYDSDPATYGLTP